MERSPRPPAALSADQLRNRRRRNLAIGLAVGCMALLFYFVTIFKVGPGVFQPMP